MYPITSDTTEFITLEEVKAQANVPASDTSHDDELGLFKEAAEEQVESLVGPVLQRQVVETVRVPPSGVVFLNRSPVLTVDSITASSQPVTGYTLASDGRLTGLFTPGDLVVTYTAGRTEAPASLRVAALIIAAHLWDTQRGNAPSAMPDAVDQSIEFGLGYSVPNRALELLAPYMLGPAIA